MALSLFVGHLKNQLKTWKNLLKYSRIKFFHRVNNKNKKISLSKL